MKDENKRRAYDLIYPSIITNRTSCDATQIAALRKSKQERAARWRTTKTVLDASIFELQVAMLRLEQEIKNLDSILAEAQKNSWATWLLSPIYKKVEESEEEKARKDRERQERRIEKDMKERRLSWKSAEMKTKQTLLRTAKEEVDTADLSDDRKIQVIQNRIWFREDRQRQERQKADMERRAKERREQQEMRKKREEEAADAWRKIQAEKRAAEQRQYEERERQKIIEQARRHREQTRHSDFTEGSTRQTSTATCRHDGCMPEVSSCNTLGKEWESSSATRTANEDAGPECWAQRFLIT
ncbi:hypothetical protein LA080_011081 [Diaporthe eres]|nr:hypothetical protein LA080_011081 [Diaporthe eres]